MRKKILILVCCVAALMSALLIPVAALESSNPFPVADGFGDPLAELDVDLPDAVDDYVDLEPEIIAVDDVRSGDYIYTFDFLPGTIFTIELGSQSNTGQKLWMSESFNSAYVEINQIMTINHYSDRFEKLTNALFKKQYNMAETGMFSGLTNCDGSMEIFPCYYRVTIDLSEVGCDPFGFRVTRRLSTSLPTVKYLQMVMLTTEAYMPHAEEASEIYYNKGVAEGRENVIAGATSKGSAAGERQSKKEYDAELAGINRAGEAQKTAEATDQATAKQAAVDQTLQNAFSDGRLSANSADAIEGVIDGVFTGVSTWFRSFLRSTSVGGLVISGILLTFVFALLAYFILKVVRG